MKVLYRLFAIVAGALAVGCGNSADEAEQRRREQQRLDSLALKVAVTPTLDCLPLFIAEEQGWFEREGVSVQLRPYTAQMDQDTALLRQRVEGMTTDRHRIEWLREQGMPVRQVATTSLKWQLISNKTARIRQLRQLDDKMVAMTRRSATDWLCQHIADSVGLKPERLFRIQINDVHVRLDMLRNGIMDAMFLPEPQATVARHDGHYVLLDTDSMGLQMGVIVFSEQVMTDTMRQRQVEQFLKVYQMAADTNAAKGWRTWSQLVAERCGVPKEVISEK
ncbi:MAG: ABC transporter substrate-binding protein [Prevotella sp.]|nr:ABC transporter substrate-binding protein [Prevotella sp.]